MLKKWMAYSYKVPLCVPYWSRTTYWNLLKNILKGEVIHGASVNHLRRVLSDYFSVPDILLCASGRVAIGIALRALGLKVNQEVIVPSFCCQSVLAPILELGARPVFADVGDFVNVTVETIEPWITSRTFAVIVPHLFGNPTDIEKVVEFCHSRGVVVIDDAAQALGATVNGRLLGTFGDAGVVSFGNGKVCFGTGGGFIVPNHELLLDKAKAIIQVPTDSWGAIVNAMSVLVWRRWRRWTLPISIILTRFRTGQIKRTMTPGAASMRNLEASVALTLLETLPVNLRRRREHILRYQENLAQYPQITLIPHSEGSSHLAQVIQLNPSTRGLSRRSQIVQNLKRNGFEVTGSYTPLHLLPPYQHYGNGPLKNIEKKWSHLIELPAEPSVSDEDIDRISDILVESLN